VKTDSMIRYEGMKLLCDKMGLIEAEKFITLINREPFDYTDWQRKLWPGKSVDETFEAAKLFREQKKD